MKKKYVVGVDLGGTKIYTALVDLEGNVVKEKIVKTEVEKGDKAIVCNIKSTIDYVIKDVEKEEIKAIGIGAPGPLDARKGIIVETPNLPFKNFPLTDKIENHYNLPVYLDNDANAAALAEHSFGAGVNTLNMVYITVSTGIGGGAILNGKIYRGTTSNALEVGHNTVKPDGPRCGCGNKGCGERMASGTAIAKRAIEAINTNVKTSLKNYNSITSKDVFEEAKKGDVVAKDIIDEALEYLGIIVSNVANTFDPDMIVIGGGVSNAGDVVFEKIEEVMNGRCLPIICENCIVKKAKLGGKSGVLGAAALAITE
ncbi:ROK family protein [Clostridium oceanicum]|uniref:Glucokinase n=1 Tax=Clostridium oceanicum TaxID=1543 RepID=A0ABN1JFU4_9CLOT